MPPEKTLADAPEHAAPAQTTQAGVAPEPAAAAPAATTAAAFLAAPERRVATPAAARMTNGIQGTLGNAAAGRMLAEAAPADVVELQGDATFRPPQPVADYLAQVPRRRAAPVNVRFGTLAAGQLEVRRDGESYETSGAQSLPLVHPALAPLAAIARPVLAVKIKDGKIEGYVSLAVAERAAPQKDALRKLIQDNPAAMGWLGLDQVRLPNIKNSIEGGALKVGIGPFPFRLGGYVRGTGSFGLENEAVTFEANATIHVDGLTDAKLEISRDAAGRLAGRVEVPVSFANFTGNVEAKYLDGVVDVRGMARYETEKLTGQITLLVTDAATARDVARAQLGPDAMLASAQDAAARPEGGAPVAGPRALAGWGQLDFRFSDWLTGKAQVIVDGEGHITVVGEITPPASVELFPQRDWVRALPRVEVRTLYGVPLVGNVFLFAGIGIDALAKLGPGTLYDIRVEGRYSTDPGILNAFSVSGRLNISAFAGLRLRGEGGIGVEIFDHDIKIGVALNALAGIRGYIEAMPTIGFREVADPLAGRKGEFYLRGHLELAAQPFLALGGELFVELDSPWWSPAPDKTWPWPLGDLEYPLPGQFGIGADIDYVIGSGQLPEVQFGEVDFNASRFMSDLMNDHVPPKRGADEERPGTWQETPPEAPPAAAAAGTDPQLADSAGAPGAEPATGRQDPAADGVPPAPDVQQRWLGGLRALGELTKSAEQDALDATEVETALAVLRAEHGFTELSAAQDGGEWNITASMNPRTRVRAKRDPLAGLTPEERQRVEIAEVRAEAMGQDPGRNLPAADLPRRRSPGGAAQPRNLSLGNAVHRWAELLSAANLLDPPLPARPLLREARLLRDYWRGGRVARADRMERTAAGGHIWEIKPVALYDEGLAQAQYYADSATREFGGTWTFSVVTYEPETATAWLTERGVLGGE